jgi:PAS domain-containing protein
MGPDGLKSCVRPAERRNGGAEPSGAAPRPLPDPIDDVAEGGLWREALEVGQVGVWAWDLDTGRVAVDRVARRIWSFPEHGSVGIAEVVACIDPEDAPAVRAALAATRETGAECHVMFRIHPPSGGSRWIRLRGRLQDGPASRVVGVTLDITERKRMEADLTATEERLRRAQELGGALPFEWDSRTDEVTAGAAFKALYGPKAARPCGWPT